MTKPLNLSGISFDKLIDASEIQSVAPPAEKPVDPSSTPDDPSKGSDPANPNPTAKVDDPANPNPNPDDKGNPSGEEGKKTVDDPNKGGDEGGGEDEDSSIVGYLKEGLGYEVEGEFDESLDGILNFTKSAIPVAAAKLLDEMFEKHPIAGQLIEHLEEGLSVESFVQSLIKPEPVKLEINEKTDFETLEKVIRHNYKEKGYSDEDTEALVSMAKDSNKLLERAKASKQEIESRSESKSKATIEAEKQALIEQQQKAQETFQKVNEIVKSGKVVNSVIPESERANFMKFISQADESGESIRQQRYNALTLEQSLYLDYLVYKGFESGKGKTDPSKDSVFQKLVAERNGKRMATSASQKAPEGTPTKAQQKFSLGNTKFSDLI